MGLAAIPAQAAVGTGAAVLINEVYGGGGNNGATYTHDFVELVNVSSSPVSLDGWTLQYAAAGADKTFAAQPLSGTIAAGATFLVQEAKGQGGATPLPTPDATGTLALSGTTGKVALVASSAVVAGPDVPPPCGGAVCQSSWPVTASSPLHMPEKTTEPFGIVHGLKLLLASAV